jgi:hypothetical protein
MLIPITFFDEIVESSGETDPYADDVVLFLKGNGTDGSTNIVDSSPANRTITRVGSPGPVISTAHSKYGGSSMLFSGSNHIHGEIDNIPGDYTVEMWVRWNVVQGSKGLFQLSNLVGGFRSTYNHAFVAANGNATSYFFTRGTSTRTALQNAAPAANTWQHLSTCRQGNNYYFSTDGTVVDYGTSGDSLSCSYFAVGGYFSNSYRSNCYIDSLRVTKGVARYTTNFDPEEDTYLNI